MKFKVVHKRVPNLTTLKTCQWECSFPTQQLKCLVTVVNYSLSYHLPAHLLSITKTCIPQSITYSVDLLQTTTHVMQQIQVLESNNLVSDLQPKVAQCYEMCLLVRISKHKTYYV